MKHLFLTALMASIMTNCIIIPPINGQQKVTIKEGTPVVEQTYEFSGFNQVTVGGFFDLQLIPSETEKVEISYFEPLQKYISAEQTGKAIELRINGVSNVTPEKINGRKTAPVARVYFKDLSKLKLSGACDGKIVSDYNAGGRDIAVELSGASELDGTVNNMKGFDLVSSGASEVEMNMTAQQIKLNLIGASELKLRGTAEYVSVKASGASDIDMEKLKAKTVEVDLSGASELDVYAAEEISGKASGASNIKVYGHPAKSRISTSGASDVKYK